MENKNHYYYVPENKLTGKTSLYDVEASCPPVPVFMTQNLTEKIDMCQLPAQLTVDIKDCWDGNLENYKSTGGCSGRQEIDKILEKPMNPCTGPICFENVKAGDILKIDIKKIDCLTGSIMTIDFEGVCGKLVYTKGEPVVKIYEIRHGNKVVLDGGYEADIHPMIGVIGVLPKEGTYPTCTPGNWGGNMDTTLIKEGATLYLPVQVDGGMLYLGDAHAQMGEGEQYTTGLEADAKVVLDIDVIKAADKKNAFMNIDTPFVKADNRLACIYTAGGKKITDAMSTIVKHSGKKNSLEALHDEIEGFVNSAVAKLTDKNDVAFVASDLREHLENFIDVPLRGVTDDALQEAMRTFIEYLVNNAAIRKPTFNDAGILCGLFGDLAISQIADDPYRTARLSMETALLKEYLGIDV